MAVKIEPAYVRLRERAESHGEDNVMMAEEGEVWLMEHPG